MQIILIRNIKFTIKYSLFWFLLFFLLFISYLCPLFLNQQKIIKSIQFLIKMEFIRKLQFMYKGYKTFTKREKPFPEITTDMTGKTFVITGANSGIGFAAAKKIAKLNGIVYLVCRN